MQVTVERLAWGGLGLARDPEGRLILLRAPLALFPGERVQATVSWKTRHGEGTVTAWDSTDPRRREPVCPLAQRCGGCDLQGAGEAAATLKEAMVADLLHRQLKGGPAWTYVPAPDGARRHRIQVHWNGRELGFHARKSHDLVGVETCPAAAKAVNQALPMLHQALGTGALPGRPQRWELITGTPEGAIWAADERGRAWQATEEGWILATSDEGVPHTWNGLTLHHRPGGFFQVTAPWALQALSEVIAAWDLRGDTLYDLYGGVGLFSVLQGHRFQNRMVVEADAPAIQWAGKNLAAAGLAGTALVADVAEWLPESLGTPADTLVLDPPRAGLDPRVAERLQGAHAGQLILLGCDGAAFCRDVQRLAPRWVLQDLVVLDLFPLTSHVECVGRFLPSESLQA